MYTHQKHGIADYGSWMQLPDNITITEGTDAIPLESQKFANLVYVINDELAVANTYSKLVVSSSGYTFTMYASAGSLSGDNNWRIQREDSVGTRMWADGNTNFDNIASNFSHITYSL